jgi:hypothetical protein
MSIPVGEGGPGTTEASSSTQDGTAGNRDDMAMDVQREDGKVSAKTNDNKSCTEQDADEDSSAPACPLFMSGLPSDFASNPSLAAIASLLGDEEYDSDVDISKVRKGLRQGRIGSAKAAAGSGLGAGGEAATVAAKPRAGGGKIGGAGAARRNNKSGSRKKSGAHRPYPTSDKKKSETKQKATVGEAQLFLNMWKL